MSLLAIDTATQTMSIALHDGDRLLAECTQLAGREHNAQLATWISRTLRQASLKAEDLTALAVAAGPGSYTGVRIGVAVAKGLAAVRALPLVPVTTLETLAAAVPRYRESPNLVVALPAGRKRIIYAEYGPLESSWEVCQPARIGDWQQVFAEYTRPMRFTGEISAEGLAMIRANREHTIVSAPLRLRRAGHLAEIAWARLREKGAPAFPAERVAPIYLQGP
ncbi:MAG: tRNA (adenosine(37)-N6)-threonylcarbamoyltransferase complex dimerization subunit type 1 TsaB [Chloroflexi bacterium]|nr:tRNA (adenosine(37)-N6)-threonylcarbamoyltransferase complex dimerization subunit type 1 TsaB [Chloroflexota bacterium]MCY4246388.1 tRNA (adenosine(37)-N6)-threonylcarbamoyltransferase complex dimerization subunit type 1 TsaB [Chloroflexota bacterium]